MDLVTVAECQSEFDAKLVMNFLEANGIRTYLSGGRASPAAGLAAGVPYGAVIQVAETDAKRVAELLQERTDDRATAADISKNWTDRVAKIIIWSVLALPLIIALGALVRWLFG